VSLSLPLEMLPDTLAICRLPPDAAVPAWATGSAAFLTVSRTPEELSVTAVQGVVPDGTSCERDYRALQKAAASGRIVADLEP